jgi:hypothetical protein
MADECTLIVETEPAINFTCADGTGIEKGAILKLSDYMTASTTTGDGDHIAGIAAEEKIANDGKTKIAVYRRGIFIGTAGTGGVTAGQAIDTDTSTSAANKLADAPVNGESIVGIAFETATSNQTFLFELNPMNYNLA